MRVLDDAIQNFRYAFRPRKPLLVARLAVAVARARLPGPPRLRYVDTAIDFACNLRCAHCFATALRDDTRPRLTPARFADVADQAMALGAVNFSFQGGEPLLAPDLADWIRACRPERNVVSVTTNGTLLSRDRVRELAALGVDILTVSLDSGVPAEHDAFRGQPGAFDRTVAGIREALDAGLHVTLGTVVTPGSINREGTRRLISLARELRLILYFIFPVPAGRWAEAQGLLLSPEEVAQVLALTRSSPYLRTDFQANLGGYGCGAAKEILYLTPYGDVLACPFLHASFGNALVEPLAVIRERALALPFLREYWQGCLASTDRAFVERYITKIAQAERKPVPAGEVFGRER